MFHTAGVSLRSINGDFGPYTSLLSGSEFNFWYQAFVIKWGVYGPCDPDFASDSEVQQWESLRDKPGISLAKLEDLRKGDNWTSVRDIPVNDIARTLLDEERISMLTWDRTLEAIERSHALVEDYQCQLRIEAEVERAISDIRRQFHLVPKATRAPKAEGKFSPRHLDRVLRAWDLRQRGLSFSQIGRKLYPERARPGSTQFEKDTLTEFVRSHYHEAERLIMNWGFTLIC